MELIDINKDSIGLIIPVKYSKTRADLSLLEKCLDSVYGKCFNKNNIKVFIGIDEGDQQTTNYVKEVISGKSYVMQLKFYYRPKKDNFVQNFYEFGAHLSPCDFFWCLGEDVEILTNNYDVVIGNAVRVFRRKLEEAAHTNILSQRMLNTFIPYITVGGEGINGLPNGTNNYCNFPILSKNFSHEGSIFPPYLFAWGVDSYLAKVYEGLLGNGIDFTIDLRDLLKIKHSSPHLGDFPKDNVFALQERRSSMHGWSDKVYGDEIQKSLDFFTRTIGVPS